MIAENVVVRYISEEREEYMNYVNLTPHNIDIVKMDGTTLSIPSSGVIRAKQELESYRVIDGIKVARYTYGEPIGVPETLEPDTIYIVSKLALESCRSHGIDTSNFLIPGNLSGMILDVSSDVKAYLKGKLSI